MGELKIKKKEYLIPVKSYKNKKIFLSKFYKLEVRNFITLIWMVVHPRRPPNSGLISLPPQKFRPLPPQGAE